jgi:hypothetical protein
MESFGTWWEGLSVILKIYWGIAVPFTLFFVLQLILSFFGAESPDDLPDAEIEADHGIPFQFLTLKNLIGFFTIFSWTGIACHGGRIINRFDTPIGFNSWPVNGWLNGGLILSDDENRGGWYHEN